MQDPEAPANIFKQLSNPEATRVARGHHKHQTLTIHPGESQRVPWVFPKGCRLFLSSEEQRQEHDPEVPRVRATRRNSYLSGRSESERRRLKPEHFQRQLSSFIAGIIQAGGKFSWQNQQGSIKEIGRKRKRSPSPSRHSWQAAPSCGGSGGHGNGEKQWPLCRAWPAHLHTSCQCWCLIIGSFTFRSPVRTQTESTGPGEKT